MKAIALAAAALLLASPDAWATDASTIAAQPDDPHAVTVRGSGDGRSDDTAALQGAIDAARGPSGGIVFLPSGRYRLSRSILVPPEVRIFGVGATRPVLVLGDRTPGFQAGVKTLIVFTGDDQYRVGRVPVPIPTLVPPDDRVRDANSGTFYSAMSNIDVELGEGNPAAAAIRFRVAQHGFLTHMDFRLGSGFAGVYQAGNEMEDVHFHGGRYGIVTEKTSPAWQFTLIDASFDGQRDAAIREHEVDLTLVDVAFRDTPIGIDIDEGYSDSFWGKDVRFENVSRAGIVISNELSPFTQIGFDNAVATRTPVFARFRQSGRTIPGAGPSYRVAAFSHGLALPGLGRTGTIATDIKAAALPSLPAPPSPAIRALPPVSEWTNVRTLGVAGDGSTDDTAALQRAIDRHRVLYLPSGLYRLTGTLHLRPDTVLIGLHPAATQLVLPDDCPAFAGAGNPVPLVETAKGGSAIVSGIGLFTGRVNPRATALLWRAGAGSLLDDVKIIGGAGTPPAEAAPSPALQGHSGDPVADNRWDAQYPSIAVTDGGGGTFADIWSADTFAQAGFAVSNTATPGHVYQLSDEHHVRNEIVLDGVRNWEFLGPQTEQEVADGLDTVPLEVRNSHDILFANYHAYRVTRTFHPAAVAIELFGSGDIRFRNLHTNAESGYASCEADRCGTFLRASKFPFENALRDRTHHLEVREREFARLDVPAEPPPLLSRTLTKVRALETGFWSISGAAAGPDGALYFVEHRFGRIYRWTDGRGLELVRGDALDPVSVAVARSGDLLVLSSLGPNGFVYSLKPDDPVGGVTSIAPTSAVPPTNADILLPVNWWSNGEFRDQYDPLTDHFTTLAEMFARDAGAAKPRRYVSPDGSLALPAFETWQQGSPDHRGWRFSHALDAYGLIGARSGSRVFVTSESEDRTYSGIVGADGALGDLRPFADRGGESVAAGPDGRIYVANGQIFVFDPAGKPLGEIDVPERPLQLVFGGHDHRTLFILTHHTLYAAGPIGG